VLTLVAMQCLAWSASDQAARGPKAARGLRSDWLATEHVLQAHRGVKLDPLTDLPHLPRDEGGPVFAEP